MSADLDLLAKDLLDEARDLLPDGGESRILGLELDGKRSRVAYFAKDGAEAPRCLTSFPAGAEHTDALAAADALATALLNKMDEAARIVAGYAMSRGSKLRVHARPETGEVAAMLLHQGEIISIGEKTIATRASIH